MNEGFLSLWDMSQIFRLDARVTFHIAAVREHLGDAN